MEQNVSGQNHAWKIHVNAVCKRIKMETGESVKAPFAAAAAAAVPSYWLVVAKLDAAQAAINR